MTRAPALRSLRALAGLAALAACDATTEPAEPAAALRAALHENQGTALLGSSRPSYTVGFAGAVDVTGAAFSSAAVRKGALEVTQGGALYSGASNKLLGARFLAADGSTLVIARACPHPRTPPGWKPPPGWTPPTGCSYPAGWDVQPDEYEYEVLVSAGGALTPLCGGGWNRAVPMSGTWDAQGGRHDSATQFSFACNGGVAVKCSNWGYKPWVNGARHQACTRLGRADYCGQGQSHTFEGTPIDVYDPVGINAAVTGPAYFEGAWTQSGALCLSKLRWQTLPPDGYCASTLPDPRTTKGARYCEDIGTEELVNLGALVFSNSGSYERGLSTWLRGSDRMLSSAGYNGGIGPSDPPEPGYAPVQIEGIAFNNYLTDTVLLRTYRDPASGDSMTTTGTPPTSYTLVRDEGYIYPTGAPLPPTAVPLSLYRSGSDYLTTTLAPPAGYALVRRDGYLPVRP